MTDIIHQNQEYINMSRNPSHSGAQAHLGRVLDIGVNAVSDLLAGRLNAGKDRAFRLAALTGTDIRAWLKGGLTEARRAAVEAWHKKTLASSGSSPQGAPAAGPMPVPPPPEPC